MCIYAPRSQALDFATLASLSPTIQELRSALASFLIRRRSDREWTQEDLAKISGIERSYLTRIEQGSCTPTLFTVFKLASAFKMKPKRFVREIEVELEKLKRLES